MFCWREPAPRSGVGPFDGVPMKYWDFKLIPGISETAWTLQMPLCCGSFKKASAKLGNCKVAKIGTATFAAAAWPIFSASTGYRGDIDRVAHRFSESARRAILVHAVSLLSSIDFQLLEFNFSVGSYKALIRRCRHSGRNAMSILSFDGRGRFDGLPKGVIVLAAIQVALLAIPVSQLSAQSAANDARSDGNDARADAMFATPGGTPVPQDNVFATTPGLEQQARRRSSHSTFWRRSSSIPTPRRRIRRRHEFGGVQPHRRRFVVDAGLQSPFRFHGEFARRGRRFTQAASVDFDKLAVLGGGCSMSTRPTTRPSRPTSPMRRDWISTRSSGSGSPRGRI